ncbi:hypothetical protein Cantr_10715 [Candida viswanathii]|uniref:Uncharacterized protein n=1 Tax=Candida viswanathii TaxID=5486 RepID=A0A367YG02_9ASCO|nr:hypothetical protein Cantr_10715 [Candida viswanathii]
MSSFVFKYILNRVLRDNQWNKFGVEDPYYEYITIDIKTNGEKKFKKIPRRIPDGLTDHDLLILQLFKKRAYRYDYWFKIFGVSFGWTNIISVIPVAGTIVSTWWSLQLLWLARQLQNGFPLDLQLLFLVNIAIDFGLGLIPFVGSIIEIGYKANSRNYLLLEKHLTRVGEMNLGIIEKEDVRPGFINDKVQPFVEDTLKPGAIKASEQVLDLLHRRPKSAADSESSSTSSITGKAATATSNTTVTTSSYQAPAEGTVSNGDRSFGEDDSRSIRSIKSLGQVNGGESPEINRKKSIKKKKKKDGKDADDENTSLMHHNVIE